MRSTITCGKAAAVVDTLGGEMISYVNDGREYIWCGDASHWSGHAPVLFPFVSALKDNKVRYNGVESEYKGKHGFARKTEFTSAKIDGGKAEFTLLSSDATKAAYPYDFALTVTHEINECGYSTTYTVKNTDSKSIMFCIGGHPGFFTDGSIEDYDLVFEKVEDCPLYYTDEKSLYSDSYIAGRAIKGETFPLCYKDFDVDALIAKDIKSRRVKLVKRCCGHGIEFDFTGFNVLVLWSPPKKSSPFVCLEPWNGMPAYTDESGEFADKPYAITLPAGESYSVGYKVKII